MTGVSDTTFRLHSFYRSSAAFRLRIGLNLKGLAPEVVFHHLRHNEQHAPDYLALNPQGFVPALEVGGEVLTQSQAILEYLDEIQPDPPLLPTDPLARAQVRAMAQLVAFPFGPVVSSSRSTNGPVVRFPIHDLLRNPPSPGAFSLLSASGRIRRTVAFAAMRSKSGNSSVHMT